MSEKYYDEVLLFLFIRGAAGTYFFGIYFFYGIYLFIEDLLGFIDGISVSARPHYPVPSLNTLTIALTLIEGLCEIYFKMYGDLLKNPNKSQINKSR
jgi:hypothetical protein